RYLFFVNEQLLFIIISYAIFAKHLSFYYLCQKYNSYLENYGKDWYAEAYTVVTTSDEEDVALYCRA
ncbi:MAG: hypothetical protein IJZ67_09365, partial [Alistipes sp.]|nr:hypothetical protein [Alistipes sp.]